MSDEFVGHETDAIVADEPEVIPEPVVAELPESGDDVYGNVIRTASHASNRELSLILVEVPKDSVSKGPIILVVP